MHVPNAEAAFVSERKFLEYLLSDTHPVGRFKAAFFKSLGYSLDATDDLKQALFAILANEVTEVSDNAYGTKYVVRGVVTGPNGTSRAIVTVWIILSEEQSPRFVTAYPEEGSDD